ncbi:hypothetical protein D6833_05725 [Candidatus Parcubacteria bacterium]|nr:MAG: hypothetical protein D6833_05725 [Candidatus Parcubacteria bacterium]
MKIIVAQRHYVDLEMLQWKLRELDPIRAAGTLFTTSPAEVESAAYHAKEPLFLVTGQLLLTDLLWSVNEMARRVRVMRGQLKTTVLLYTRLPYGEEYIDCVAAKVRVRHGDIARILAERDLAKMNVLQLKEKYPFLTITTRGREASRWER